MSHPSWSHTLSRYFSNMCTTPGRKGIDKTNIESDVQMRIHTKTDRCTSHSKRQHTQQHTAAHSHIAATTQPHSYTHTSSSLHHHCIILVFVDSFATLHNGHVELGAGLRIELHVEQRLDVGDEFVHQVVETLGRLGQLRKRDPHAHTRIHTPTHTHTQFWNKTDTFSLRTPQTRGKKTF